MHLEDVKNEKELLDYIRNYVNSPDNRYAFYNFSFVVAILQATLENLKKYGEPELPMIGIRLTDEERKFLALVAEYGLRFTDKELEDDD